jgi:cytochrome c oxidase subunit 1
VFTIFVYLVHSIYRGKPAGNNPWGALSLEWETTSPPHPHNFKSVPEITHGPYDYDKILVEPTYKPEK